MVNAGLRSRPNLSYYSALIIASNDAMFDAKETTGMRTTVTLDDELLMQAQEMTGISDKSALIRTALEKLVQREAARRLALLGGSAPDFIVPPRRRFTEDRDDPG